MTRTLGWKRDPLDPRDKPFAAPIGSAVELPQSFSLRKHVKHVLDQGQTSSCVAHAYAQAIAICEDMAGLPYDPISRLYLYHCARALTGDEHEDAGTYLRSAAKALQVMGAPPEPSWPFRKSAVNVQPGIKPMMLAHPRRGGTYRRITGSGSARLHSCRAAIASGYPFVFGTDVSESFLLADGPERIERPSGDDPIVGGHAVVAVSYDPGGFEICNSWGTGWRNGGFAWLSNAYIASYASSDFWLIQSWQRIKDARARQEALA